MVEIDLVDLIPVVQSKGSDILRIGGGGQVEGLIDPHLIQVHPVHVLFFHVGDAIQHGLEHQVLFPGDFHDEGDQVRGNGPSKQDLLRLKVIDDCAAGAGAVADPHVCEMIEGKLRNGPSRIQGQDLPRRQGPFEGTQGGGEYFFI